MRAEETNITYEECLQRATPSLRKKIIHGIELLQKAEKIALKYSEDGFRIGFSGGKDSQATYHLTKIAGVKFKAWFNPTSVDPPEVIHFIRKEYPSVKFGKLEKSIFQAAIDIGCLPTMKIRWCCAEFKENKGAGMVNVVGVRKAESTCRAKRKEVEVSSHKFQGDLNEFEGWSKERIDKVMKRHKNINQDQFAEVQSESTIRCVGGKDSIIIMPILEWTERDVWEFLNEVVRVPHCELYDKGRHRIGCIMCPMSGLKDILRDIKEYPRVYRNWLRVVRAIRNGEPTPYSVTPPITQGADKQGIVGENSSAITPLYWSTTYEDAKRLLYDGGGYQKRKPMDRSRVLPIQTKSNISNKFLPSPTGEGYINTPEELIVDWWISKKSFKKWYADKFLQQKLDFEDDDIER